MKVFKRGGFIIVQQTTKEHPIPLLHFDYEIVGTDLRVRDVIDEAGYYSEITTVTNEGGTAIGNADQVADYLADLVADASKKERLLKNANDLIKTFTYLDAGTSDERVSTIEYSSVLLGFSATETFVYAGSSGSYRVSTITLS